MLAAEVSARPMTHLASSSSSHGFLENDCATNFHADDLASKQVDSVFCLPGELEDILKMNCRRQCRGPVTKLARGSRFGGRRDVLVS
jgi:hypothetical protein